MPPRFRRAAIGISLVGIALLGSWFARHHQRYKHLAVHVPGRVYRSAWLAPDAIVDLIGTYRIRTVVNLCDPGELGEQRWIDERRSVAATGAQLVEIAMPADFRTTDARIEKHLGVLMDPDAYPLLVHCQHGVERTAQYMAMYDIIHRDMQADESLAGQPLFGRDDYNSRIRRFLNDFEQHWKSGLLTADVKRPRLLAE